MASVATYECENMLGEEEVGVEGIKCKNLALVIELELIST